MKKSVDGKKEYVTPVCELARVELEDGMCVASEASIKKETIVIEAAEYTSIDNDITFN